MLSRVQKQRDSLEQQAMALSVENQRLRSRVGVLVGPGLIAVPIVDPGLLEASNSLSLPFMSAGITALIPAVADELATCTVTA